MTRSEQPSSEETSAANNVQQLSQELQVEQQTSQAGLEAALGTFQDLQARLGVKDQEIQTPLREEWCTAAPSAELQNLLLQEKQICRWSCWT